MFLLISFMIHIKHSIGLYLVYSGASVFGSGISVVWKTVIRLSTFGCSFPKYVSSVHVVYILSLLTNIFHNDKCASQILPSKLLGTMPTFWNIEDVLRPLVYNDQVRVFVNHWKTKCLLFCDRCDFRSIYQSKKYSGPRKFTRIVSSTKN